jgi:hypothetical protein
MESLRSILARDGIITFHFSTRWEYYVPFWHAMETLRSILAPDGNITFHFSTRWDPIRNIVFHIYVHKCFVMRTPVTLPAPLLSVHTYVGT